MKIQTLTLAVLIAFQFNAFAEGPCLGDICYNDTVIDSYDLVGTVVGVNARTNKIIYQRDGYGSTSEASPSELGKEITSARFPLGSTVIDSYDLVGKVENVFSNQKIKYKRDGYGSSSISKDLSPEIASLNSISSGVRVIDSYDLVGTAKKVFENGKIQYLRDGYGSTSISRSLWPEITSSGPFTAGIRVIDNYDLRGTLSHLFANQRVQYQRDGYGSTTIAPLSSLKEAVESLNGISKKSLVIDDYNLIGTVDEIFSDGRISYLRQGYGSNSISKRLSPETTSLSDGNFKSGVFVVDDYNLVGKVEHLFKDGRVSYMREGYGSATVKNVSGLSYEVSASVGANYSKDVDYAINGAIGKPIRFFANGSTQIKTASGSTYVSDALYEEVPILGAVKAGDTVVAVSKITCVITRLFKNNTIEIKVPAIGKIKERLASTVLLTPESQSDKSAIHTWLRQAFMYASTPGEDDYRLGDYAVVSSDYVTFKATLLDSIKDRVLMFDREQIKLVTKYLED